MAASSYTHKHVLVRLTFVLGLFLTLGIVFILAIDHFFLQPSKFLSSSYLLVLLVPDVLLLAGLYHLSSLDKATIFFERLRWKLGWYIFFVSLYMIGVVSYLAYIPKPDVIIVEAGIFVLVLFGITILVYPNIDWSSIYLLSATIVVAIVLLEIASRILGSATASRVSAQLSTSISGNEGVYLDYGDVNTPPAPALFREGGELLPELNVWVVGESPKEGVKFVTNSKGFRNEQEFFYNPPQGTYRILYIGDSFVAGYRVGQDFTSAKIMENKLRELSQTYHASQSVEVLAVTIGEPAAAWLWLEEYGFRYKPDLIVLGLTLGNDIYQTYIATDSGGYLDIIDNKILQSGSRTIGFRTPPINRFYLPDEAFLFSPTKNSFLNVWVQEILHRIKAKFSWTSLGKLIDRIMGDPGTIASWYQDTFPSQVYAFDPSNGLGLFYKPVLTQVDQGFLRTEKVLQGLNERTQDEGSDFLVVFFPQRFQVTEADWRSTRERYFLDPLHFDLDYPSYRLADICSQNNIICLDLLDELKDVAKLSAEPLYLPLGDMHWNSNGQKVAGAAIAEFIWQEYLRAYFH